MNMVLNNGHITAHSSVRPYCNQKCLFIALVHFLPQNYTDGVLGSAVSTVKTPLDTGQYCGWTDPLTEDCFCPGWLNSKL